MQLKTPSAPHIHAPVSVFTLMGNVMLALIPGAIAYIWFFGWGWLVQAIIAGITALVFEAAMLHMRDRPLAPFLTDGSALVTAVLLAFCIPPLAPWWVVFLGTAFAIVIAKHLYGGLGYNPFNPAMVGYVMLLISFPREMTNWLAPLQVSGQSVGMLDTLNIILTQQFPAAIQPDSLTMATPLDAIKTELGRSLTLNEIYADNPIFGFLGGAGWEWTNLWLLLGGIWLIHKNVISWHIPVGLLTGLTAIALTFYLIDTQRFASPLLHLFSGATMLGAFFIATDPVSASTTNRGRLIFGAGIGMLTYIIRTWGGYPDGIAFAVLLMNMAAPTIDYYTQPRVFGDGRN